MANYRLIETHGDPLFALRKTLRNLWLYTGFDSMLVPLYERTEQKVRPSIIRDPHLLDNVNPFVPLMTTNAATALVKQLNDHPKEKIGAILRPCEIRALQNMIKLDGFSLENISMICVDCLGIQPFDEIQRQEKVSDNIKEGANQKDKLPAAGKTYRGRLRSSCQICSNPGAEQGDININFLGLPIRQFFLINFNAENNKLALNLDTVSDGEPDSKFISQHEMFTAKMIERNRMLFERLSRNLFTLLPKDVNDLIDQIEGCESCQKCMDLCPICSVKGIRKSSDGFYERGDVVQWIMSCVGCSVCDQVCADHLPLSIVFLHMQRLQEVMLKSNSPFTRPTLPM